MARWSFFVSVLGLVLVLVYVVSRVLTDRFGWSQWLWWAPAGWWVSGAWLALGVSGVLGVMGWLRGARKTAGGDLFWVYLLVCVGMVVHLLVWVVRVPNSIGGYGIHWTSNSAHERVRVMHWNIAAGSFDEERVMEWMVPGNIDLVLLANTRFDGQRRALMEGLGDRLSERMGGEFEVRGLSRALVASRYPILKAQVVYVSASGKEGPSEEAVRATGDFGWVVMLTLDGGEMYGVFDVWLVDLPSEPTVHRMESMARVVEMVRARLGEEVAAPALVIGDFNTVRGSASLGAFDVFSENGFEDAFAARGAGRGTWRPMGLGGLKGWAADRSSWGIDLALVGNGWRTHGYELVIPDGAEWERGGVSHLAQVVDIERAD